MAPDINTVSVPQSPQATARTPTSHPPSNLPSRRASQMGPPPLPLGSPGGTIPQSLQSHMTSISSPTTGGSESQIPMRHPRPLTQAELHLELEKEQEAVVNRLTRELSALRAQTASVVSNTSSTSTGLVDPVDPNPTNMMTGATHPIPARRDRSSSTVSTRSNTNSTAVNIGSLAGTPVPSAYERPPYSALSRQPSMAQSQRSGASSPALLAHRPSISSQVAAYPPITPTALGGAPLPTPPMLHARSPSVSSTRYEEAAMHKAELDAVKAENEALKRRIRELERVVRERRASMASVAASETSVSTQGPREEVADDESIKVGESAATMAG